MVSQSKQGWYPFGCPRNEGCSPSSWILRDGKDFNWSHLSGQEHRLWGEKVQDPGCGSASCVILGKSPNISVLVYSSTKWGGWQEDLRFFLLKNFASLGWGSGVRVTASQTHWVNPWGLARYWQWEPGARWRGVLKPAPPSAGLPDRFGEKEKCCLCSVCHCRFKVLYFLLNTHRKHRLQTPVAAAATLWFVLLEINRFSHRKSPLGLHNSHWTKRKTKIVKKYMTGTFVLEIHGSQGLRNSEMGLLDICPGSFFPLSPFTTQIMVINIFLSAFNLGTEALQGIVGGICPVRIRLMDFSGATSEASGEWLLSSQTSNT